MEFLVSLLVSAGVVVLVSYIMPQIEVKSFTTALWVAFLIGILNATVGFLLRLPLNIVTLGLLTFVVRMLVSAVVIKLVDKLVSNFTVRGFWPALALAAALAIAGTLVDNVMHDHDRQDNIEREN